MSRSQEIRLIRFQGSRIRIGRDPSNDEVIDEPSVSRFHAEIDIRGEELVLRDLGSENGTLVSGRRVTEVALQSGAEITIGGRNFVFEGAAVAGELVDESSVQVDDSAGERVALPHGATVRIGRDPANDLVLERPTVSRFHAEVHRGESEVILRDLGSRNGTLLGGKPVKRDVLEPGAEIRIGPYRIAFDGESLVVLPERAALRLVADSIAVSVKKKRILSPTSASIAAGELVVIIGESGSGKSTLLKSMAGVAIPTEGLVTVSGEPVGTMLSEFGYLPQDEIVHGRLSVTESLRYAARLRLPDDTQKDEIETSIEGVLTELSLAEHADTRIDSLSGGQRQRAALAPELLNQPSFLFLDEPATGLDPGLETRMMRLLREIADRGPGVILVTHATKNLELCDRVYVMGRGGELCFQGTPKEAGEFFGVSSYDDIYTALTERPATEWRRDFEARGSAEPVHAMHASAPKPRRRPGAGFVRQAAVLVHRYARTFSRDRRNVAILLGQTVPIALVIALLYEAGIFDRPGGNPRGGAQLLFLTVTTAIWLGSISAAREVVKEWGVLERERAVGVRISAYLTSKAIVLFTVAAIQAILLGAVVFTLRPLEVEVGDYVMVFAILVATSVVAVGMGLLISSVVRTQDQATSFIPIALIPQLLLGGAIVPVEEMSGAMKVISGFVFARWSFAGIGSAVDMNGRIGELGRFARAKEFGDSFFDLEPVVALLILGGFLGALFALTAFVLRRRTDPRVS